MSVPRDTAMGGPGKTFPSTRWSMIAEAGDPDSPKHRRELEALCQLYWKPAYVYFRVARSADNEQAKELTQSFFCELIEGDLLSRYSSDRGSFRAYLCGALHLFWLERRREAGAQKRGGGKRILTIDDGEARFVEQLVSQEAAPNETFDRQWANSVLDLAKLAADSLSS